MPFDPNFPPTGVGLVSADWRTQFGEMNNDTVALAALVAAQAATITALDARVAALEAMPPGGITQAQLDAAIATTARNPDTVSPPGVGASDPPTQSEVQTGFDFSANLHGALLRT